MLRRIGIQGVSLREDVRNEEIRKAATVQPITTHLMLVYCHLRCSLDGNLVFKSC